MAKGDAKASLEYVLGMTSNIYAIRGDFAGIASPVWLRLYRHRDTAHLMYMTADGKTYTNPEAEADKAFNGPIDPPTSGQDGPILLDSPEDAGGEDVSRRVSSTC